MNANLDNSERGTGDYAHAALIFIALFFCVIGVLTSTFCTAATGLFLMCWGVAWFYANEGME